MPGFKFGRADGGHATVVGEGTVIGAATPIVENTNYLTSETGETAFQLPAKHPSGSPIVVRGGTVAALVFPGTGGIINALAADASFSVTAAKTAVFYPVDNSDTVTDWIAVLSA
jgi:hypothetical protein